MLVDIHNHILPGLDDGPESIEEDSTNAFASLQPLLN
ncbi:CpsB/CapC family capsule biosynthesis tyrosine phosphatase [Psychrobacillus antarcticus]|nr:CpsB/CapC family capsule biosynthesis tyrosine phosphatase [Psychrobacillus antarcticus]